MIEHRQDVSPDTGGERAAEAEVHGGLQMSVAQGAKGLVWPPSDCKVVCRKYFVLD